MKQPTPQTSACSFGSWRLLIHHPDRESLAVVLLLFFTLKNRRRLYKTCVTFGLN